MRPLLTGGVRKEVIASVEYSCLLNPTIGPAHTRSSASRRTLICEGLTHGAFLRVNRAIRSSRAGTLNLDGNAIQRSVIRELRAVTLV